VFIDLFDILLRLVQRRIQSKPADPREPAPTSIPLNVGRFNPYQRKLHLRPYALAISVHDLGDELDEFVAAMAPHRSRLYVIDDASSDLTAYRLEAAGLRVIRGDHNRHKPGAIRELLRHLPKDVETILIMDPDSRVMEFVTSDISTLESVIFDFQRSGHAALCPHITVERNGWLTRFQRLEYALAFGVGRKSLGDYSITSGIAIYRRDTLDRILSDHSLSVYAEDLENTLHLLSRDERIYYDERLVIETEGKTDLAGWFSQRVGWSFGLAKVYAQNVRKVWLASRGNLMHFYQYLVYLGIFSLLLHPLKVLSVLPLCASALNGIDGLLGLGIVPDTELSNPWYFPLVYAKYAMLMALAVPMACPPRHRLEHVPCAVAYLFYALAHLVPQTIGFLNWICLRIAGRRIYRDHFADDVHAHG
jgi:cellulose synthase/poly-beta-1,6-N-acetylglucosamine synthase-like glycosyltransferase